MSKRLQVLLPDRETLEIQRLARDQRMTVGEWVRRTLREARMRKPATDAETKLKAVRGAASFAFPTADIDTSWTRSNEVTGVDLHQLERSDVPRRSRASALIAAGERLVTDAEVLQEILHRCTAINRREAIEPALRVILAVVDEVFAIEKANVLRAAEIAQKAPQI